MTGPRWLVCVLTSGLVLVSCGSVTSTASRPEAVAVVVTTEPITNAFGEPTTIVIGGPPPIVGMAAEIFMRAGDAMRSFDPSSDPVKITLRADQRELAQQFVDQYDAKVAVTLGAFPFPNIDASTPQLPPASCVFKEVPASSGDASLEWSLLSPPLTSVSGADLNVSTSIKNGGPQAFRWFSGGTDAASVTARGSRRVIGFSDVGKTAEGHSGTVEPGQSLARSAYGGTGSCDASLGWALPPGEYDVYVVFTTLGVDGTKSGDYISPPFPLTITNEKPKLPTPRDVPERVPLVVTPPPTTDSSQTTRTVPTEGPPVTVLPVTAPLATNP
jgi:hypothetical protein